MARLSPTARSLNYARKHGWEACVVERWNNYSGRHTDMFGFADLVVLDGETITAVQTTSADNMAARVKKILAEPRALTWLQSGGRIEVWGWAKRKQIKQDGSRGALRWIMLPRIIEQDAFHQQEDTTCSHDAPPDGRLQSC